MRYEVGEEVMLHPVTRVEIDEAVGEYQDISAEEARYWNTFLRNKHPDGVTGRILYAHAARISAVPYRVELVDAYLPCCIVYVNEINVRPIRKQLNLEVMV